MLNKIENKTITTTTKPAKPIINLILIHKCCISGTKMVKKYIVEHPEENVTTKSYSLFNSRDNGMLKKYNIDIKTVEAGISYLIKDDLIIDQGKG